MQAFGGMDRPLKRPFVGPHPSVVVMGFDEADLPRLRNGLLPPSSRVHLANQLTPHLLKDINLTIVVSPLIAATFDALEMALRLTHLDYRGVYRVLIQPLPRSDMVRGELAQAAPALRLEFRTLGS